MKNYSEHYSHRNSHTHLQAAQANPQTKLAKECACPTQKEFQNIFFLAFKKLKHLTHKLTMQTADIYRHDNWTTEKEAHAHNKGLPKAGVTSFYDSFVLNQTLVFQMNGSAETPRLRQAPNRYLQPLTASWTG